MHPIIDTPDITTARLSKLKALGIKTIIRYVNPGQPHGSKTIKEAEARAIAKAGMRLAIVCEGYGDFAHGAISAAAGERDGKFCASYMAGIGAPSNAGIYFAVDVDASAAQVTRLVIPYFTALVAHVEDAGYRAGAYGSGAVCQAAWDAELIDFTWLSGAMGWRGSRDYLASNSWNLRQYLPIKLVGLDVDPNDSNGEDFGDFVPFAGEG